MTSEGLGKMLKVTLQTCALNFFPLMLMGGRAAEVNKVAKPANLVGRKCCDSLGLTENIPSKSLIIVAVLLLLSEIIL